MAVLAACKAAGAVAGVRTDIFSSTCAKVQPCCILVLPLTALHCIDTPGCLQASERPLALPSAKGHLPLSELPAAPVMSITWHIDNLSAFKDILETRKLFSKCAPARCAVSAGSQPHTAAAGMLAGTSSRDQDSSAIRAETGT